MLIHNGYQDSHFDYLGYSSVNYLKPPIIAFDLDFTYEYLKKTLSSYFCCLSLF